MLIIALVQCSMATTGSEVNHNQWSVSFSILQQWLLLRQMPASLPEGKMHVKNPWYDEETFFSKH